MPHKWMRVLWYQLGLVPKPWNLESKMCQSRTNLGCETGSLTKMLAFEVAFHIHNKVLLERLMLFLKASVLYSRRNFCWIVYTLYSVIVAWADENVMI